MKDSLRLLLRQLAGCCLDSTAYEAVWIDLHSYVLFTIFGIYRR
jgi:hypothetical protein